MFPIETFVSLRSYASYRYTGTTDNIQTADIGESMQAGPIYYDGLIEIMTINENKYTKNKYK